MKPATCRESFHVPYPAATKLDKLMPACLRRKAKRRGRLLPIGEH